jgi:hypothetical protein
MRIFRYAPHAKAESDIVDAVEMGKERVALKHHGGSPTRWRQRGHACAANDDFAAGRNLMSGDHAQGCGFTAARWAKQAAIATDGDLGRNRIDRHSAAKDLGQRDELHFG